MKIIIVGGGIAGLTTYLHLRKHLPEPELHTTTILESHRSSSPPSQHSFNPVSVDTLSASTAIVGGGLGIAPNGMRVLRHLDPVLHARVVAQGFRAENFVFKGANGWTLGTQSTCDEREGGKEVCVASSRHGLWETIKRYVEETYSEGAVRYAKVVGIERTENGMVKVRYVDEKGVDGVEEADLVIGADGVKSVVRRVLFGEDERYTPTYTGQSGVGGFLNIPIPPFITDSKAMVFSFGGNGFFGYSSSGPPSSQQLMWWSTFETSSLPDTRDIDPQGIKTALMERHKNWKDPTIQDIVKNAEVQSIYPTWALPELPHWGERGIVLIGDAAHAMDPTTGQGASQALEDGQTLALLLGDLLSTAPEPDSDAVTINTAIKLFHEIRSPRVHAIIERGKKLAGSKTDINVLLEYSMYCVLLLITKLPFLGKLVLGDVNRELNSWSARNEIRKVLHEEEIS